MNKASRCIREAFGLFMRKQGTVYIALVFSPKL